MIIIRSAITACLFALAAGQTLAAEILFHASYDKSLQPERSATNPATMISDSAPPRFVGGIRGDAVVVGANSWIKYTVGDNLLPGKGSISLLTKPVGWNGDDGMHHFFVSAQAGSGDWIVVYKTPENKFLFTGGNTTNYSYAETSAEQWKDGVWKHVCVTWDDGTAKIYLDGALVATRKWPVVAKSLGNEFTIGGTVFGQSKGEQTIDELTIYNAALSKEDVATLYAGYKSELGKANASVEPDVKKKP